VIKIAKKKKYGYTVRDEKGYPQIKKMTEKQAKKKVSKGLKKTAKKKKYPKMKRGSTATRKDIRKKKAEIKSWRVPEKKTKKKGAYLISLKREKAMAEKGWKVARTKTYLTIPKRAIGKKGYPYAVLNENSNYESFYTWKEKTSKKDNNNER